MQRAHDPSGRLRFGVFEVDLRAGELAKRGQRIRLQEQPFQVLAMLLEKPGELVTREELQKKLWGQTVVDFDHLPRFAPWLCCHWRAYRAMRRRIISPMG